MTPSIKALGERARRIPIAGYGYSFGITNGRDIRVMPSKVAIVGNTSLLFMHNDQMRYASAYGETLEAWHDEFGLAWQAWVDDWGLVDGIRSGAYSACSVLHDKRRLSHRVVENGRTVEVVTLPSISEITICPEGADPTACCWLVDAEPSSMPAHIQAARARWLAGWRRRQTEAQQRVADKARAVTVNRSTALRDNRTAVPASVTRALAQWPQTIPVKPMPSGAVAAHDAARFRHALA